MNIYVIRARKASKPFPESKDEIPIYVACELKTKGGKYTTDKKYAQLFSSLFSADVAAQGLNDENPEYLHVADIFRE